MRFDWDVVPGPTNWRAVQQYLHTHSDDTVVLPADYVRDTFAEGEEYVFTLNVTNHFNYTSTSPASYSVSFAFDPVPTLSVVPMHRLGALATRVGQSIKLHGAAIASGCAITFLEPHDDLQYSWTQLEGPAFQVNDDTSNTPVLYMGPGTLKANQTYTLNLRAQHASYTSFLGETQVELSVIPTSPFTEIGGSALRAFPLTRDPRVALVLDASSSIDFDGLAGEFVYHWSCTNTATEEDCWYSGTDEYYLVNAARLVIPSYELPIGEFLFSVTAQKEGGLSATATLIVRTNSVGPVVTARVLGSGNNDNVVNANDKVILSASAQSTASDEGLQWKWSVESGPLLDSDLEQVLESSRYLPNLVIKANILGADQAYTFRVEATDSTGTGYALVDLVVHPRPAAGSCELFVNNSRAVTGREEAYVHTFSVVCNHWEDLYTEGEAPLRYRFFAEPAGTGKRHPLASGLSDQPSLRFLLPPGNARLHVEVLDQNGVSASYDLSATARLSERERLLMTDEELAGWVRDNVFQPAITSADMATVGQAIWFITDLINGQSNATQARRSLDDEVAVMERIIAITGSPADAQAEQVRQLREQMDLLDTQQQTRHRLRTNLIEALQFDYAVEYDSYTVVQRLGYLDLLAQGGAELSDAQVETLVGLLHQLTDRLGALLGSPRRSSSIQRESMQAFLDAYSDLNLAANQAQRSAAFRQKCVAALQAIFRKVVEGESAGVVAGESAETYASDYFTLQWGTHFVSLLESTLTGSQSTVEVSEAAFRELAQASGGGALKRALTQRDESSAEASLAIDEAQLQFVFTEYQSNLYSWSPSSDKISTPVMSIRYYVDGEERQVNVSEAVTVTLPILSFPALTFSTAGGEVDLHYYIPRCQVWDPTAQAFSAAFCSVKSFTTTLIQCACSRFGEFGATLEVNQTALVSPSPSASSAPIVKPADTSRDWLSMDQAVLLTIFVIAMVILLFLAVVWVYWSHKHEVPNDDADALYFQWEAEADDDGAGEAEPPALPELEEEEDELWLPDPYYYPEDYTGEGSDAPPDEDDEEDNLELVEWTGNRGETRLTRIAQGAGERGVYGVTSTKRQPGYTNLTFQMGPRLKRSESIRSATSVVKKKELQAKASINIQSQSSSKRGQV